MKSNQRYIPEILEDILKELKKINAKPKAEKPATNKIEKRPLPDDLH